MFKRTMIAAIVLFAVTACSDSPMVPEANVTPLGVSSGGGGALRIMICHLDAEILEPDADGPGWELLAINEKSLDKHLAHGDGVPGGEVPDGEGSRFDANCGVVPPVEIPTCVQRAISDFNSKNAVPFEFANYSPWALGFDLATQVKIEHVPTTEVGAQDQGSGTVYCYVLVFGYTTGTGFVNDDSYQDVRTYLLSFVN